jgi:ribonuclease-3
VSEELQNNLGHPFSDETLLEVALTHSTWAHERGGPHNERLEWLGDSLLNAAVTLELFRRFPTADEGKLSELRSRLVNTDVLGAVARDLDLGACLRLGRGEVKTGGRDKTSVLADAVEAVLGAVYLDADFDRVRTVVEDLLADRMEALDDAVPLQVVPDLRSPRNRLQEYTQKKWKKTPVYVEIRRDGPQHDPLVEVEVRLDERPLGRGVGKSKKLAAGAAAVVALRAFEESS